jgi:hypothetical protein
MLFWKGFTRFTWPTRRRGVWHRFNDRAGAPTNEALGRSRGGFSTKIHAWCASVRRHDGAAALKRLLEDIKARKVQIVVSTRSVA